MGNLNFSKDLAQEKKNIRFVQKELQSKKGFISSIVQGKDKGKDLIIESPDRHLLEAKEDMKCAETGNIAIECHSRGELSGISTTESDLWFETAHCSDGMVRGYLAKTEAVKKLIEEKKFVPVRGNLVKMGDIGSDTYGYLFRLSTIVGISELVFEIPRSQYYEQLRRIH